ncbi:hypothetical protein ACIBH1_42950 [Nonomuraea sp. NPDC050663]
MNQVDPYADDFIPHQGAVTWVSGMDMDELCSALVANPEWVLSAR